MKTDTKQHIFFPFCFVRLHHQDIIERPLRKRHGPVPVPILHLHCMCMI